MHKLKSPDQIVHHILTSNIDFVITRHEGKEGIVFDSSSMKEFSWFKESFNAEKDGVKIFQKMRTRHLTDKKEKWAVFLRYEYLMDDAIESVKQAARISEETNNGELHMVIDGASFERIVDSVDLLFSYFVEE